MPHPHEKLLQEIQRDWADELQEVESSMPPGPKTIKDYLHTDVWLTEKQLQALEDHFKSQE